MSGYPGGGQQGYDDGYGQRGQGGGQNAGADPYYQDNDQYYYDNSNNGNSNGNGNGNNSNGYEARGGQHDGYYDESYVVTVRSSVARVKIRA